MFRGKEPQGVVTPVIDQVLSPVAGDEEFILVATIDEDEIEQFPMVILEKPTIPLSLTNCSVKWNFLDNSGASRA